MSPLWRHFLDPSNTFSAPALLARLINIPVSQLLTVLFNPGAQRFMMEHNVAIIN